MPQFLQEFLDTAESCKQSLSTTSIVSSTIVTVEPSKTTPLGWAANKVRLPIEELEPLSKGQEVIIDFGGHRVGHFSFTLTGVATGSRNPDAPARLRLVFGEILSDVAESFEPYTGWLSRSWLPEEIINVDFLPQEVYMPRRYAFRYVKIEVIDTSIRYGVKFSNCIAHALTSAPLSNDVTSVDYSQLADLQDSDITLLKKIDEVSLRTLSNCMQTVYEDGPRRDMRLWLGDLRVQALTSYATNRDFILAKRCLYLFAGLPMDDQGAMCSSVYEKPAPRHGGSCIVDYSILFAITLDDYVTASGDTTTGMELYKTAKTQLEIALQNVDPSTWLYIIPRTAEDGKNLHFIDWNDPLDKVTSVHAILVVGLKALRSLVKSLDLKDSPVMFTPTSTGLQETRSISSLIDLASLAAQTHLFSKDRGVFVSGESKQISWHSQIWCVLAGIPENRSQATSALLKAYRDENAIKGKTPYVHHYLVAAFIELELIDEALSHIKSYWGSMIEAGAETFFECWDPDEPRGSPYGDFHVNSFCHAWSVGPALFLRMIVEKKKKGVSG